MDNYNQTTAVSTADIYRALGRATGGPIDSAKSTIDSTGSGSLAAKDDIPNWVSVVNGNTTISGKITTTASNISVSTMKQNTKTDFDEITWTVEVPGVPREDIEVFQVQDVVYVEVKDKGRVQYLLSPDEKILSSKLDLGILTVIIDRPHKKVAIEVG